MTVSTIANLIQKASSLWGQLLAITSLATNGPWVLSCISFKGVTEHTENKEIGKRKIMYMKLANSQCIVLLAIGIIMSPTIILPSISREMAIKALDYIKKDPVQKKEVTPFWYDYIMSCSTNVVDSTHNAENSGKAPQRIFDFDEFLDYMSLWQMANNPEDLTNHGIFEPLGVREHNAYLADLSPEQALFSLEEQKKLHAWLTHNIDSATLTPSQKISYAILMWDLEQELRGEPFLFHDYIANQMDNIAFSFSLLFAHKHPLSLPEDIEHYAQRLMLIPMSIDQTIATLELQQKAGIIPPQFTIQKVIRSIEQSLPERHQEHLFYTHMATTVKTAPDLAPDEQKALEKISHALHHHVYPAYQKLHAYLVELLPYATTNHGVWSLPNGDAYYAYMLKSHTTTDMTPDEIYAIGLQEVASIQAKMRELLAQCGFQDHNKKLGLLMQEFAQDPIYYYSNDDQGRAACLAGFVDILERSRKELGHLFGLKPRAALKIERVPEHEQEGQPGAYYTHPTLDGSRPGIFFANLRDMSEMPKFEMETLTIHEAEPGHHFQIALQNESSLPFMRRTGCYTAYAEGWALYAEKVACEHNFYSSPAYQLGHLQNELMRAVRLVVDTGIHHRRWTPEQAITYMQEELGQPYDTAVTEVERYFVLPGQACAYKIGQLKLLELRQYMKDSLGDRFDIRDFHNIVLTTGSVPLTVLERVIKEYVEQRKAQQ